MTSDGGSVRAFPEWSGSQHASLLGRAISGLSGGVRQGNRNGQLSPALPSGIALPFRLRPLRAQNPDCIQDRRIFAALNGAHGQTLVSAALERFDCRNSHTAACHARQSGVHSTNQLSCRSPDPISNHRRTTNCDDKEDRVAPEPRVS